MDTRFEQDDYAAPLVFTRYVEAYKFAEAHVCPDCLGHLNVLPSDQGFVITCLVDGPITRHNPVRIEDAWKIESQQHGARLEINHSTTRPKREASVILKELGF